jgi:hypothetical protein
LDGDGMCDVVCEDLDGDGLCDCLDVNGDGLCDPENYRDSDGDGLFDCEERYTGTNRSGADTDGDGLVDFLEVRFGTGPDIDDSADDFDWDAVSNGEEVMTATDPHHVNVFGRSKQAYRYKTWESTGVESQSCYEFEIKNISLTEVISSDGDTVKGPAGQGYSGRNRILVYMGEVPFDDVESYARFRVACVEAYFKLDGNFKNPPSGVVHVSDEDFVNLTEFDPIAHCIPPGGRR